MPCPHFNITVVQRSQGRSAVAAAAYQSCGRIYSDYDMKWKNYTYKKKELVHEEILLPGNAPPEYADRQTLWNAVEGVENQWNTQLARRFVITLPKELSHEENIRLAREYIQKQFVSKGMIADLCIHDKGDDNPHAHVLLTLRAMDEQGRWLPKCHKEYVLDENGERIKMPNGRWKSLRVNTVDWNEQKYGEIWRHEWETIQNRYLEAAGRTERIDMRSFERQGNPHAPQIHLGPAVSAMERKGIETNIGNLNREIVETNRLYDAIRNAIRQLQSWLIELKEKLKTEEPEQTPESGNLIGILLDYMNQRKANRSDWSQCGKNKAAVNDLNRVSHAMIFLRENGIQTVHDLGIHLNQTGEQAKDLKSRINANNKRCRDIDALIEAAATVEKYRPLHDQYAKIGWKAKKEKFAEEHADDLKKYNSAFRLLKKFDATLPLDSKALRSEQKNLRKENAELTTELKAVQEQLEELKLVRWCVRQVIPDALPTISADGKKFVREALEANQRKAKLQEEQKAVHQKQEQER